MTWVSVSGVSSNRYQKFLHLEDGSKLVLHRFACAGTGDHIRRTGEAVWVNTLQGEVQVSPAFDTTIHKDLVPGCPISLRVRELTAPEDLEAHEALAQFHYRNVQGFGRRSILLLTCQDPLFPRELGFVEITTPFLNLKNRSVLFDAPFCEPGSSVSWTSWDLATRNRLINVVARISRFVVHPEVRGLGLTRPLLYAAAEFSRTRWNVKGIRPLFLEITAEMLRLMPFVDSSGMQFIGQSEGNLGRLAKDMAYLDRAFEAQRITGATSTGLKSHSVLSGIGKGILRLQKRDITLLQRLREDSDPEVDMEAFIRSLLRDGHPEPGAWEKLLPVLRFPKPTYMSGLTPYADAFVHDRVNSLGIDPPDRLRVREVPPASGDLRITALSLSFEVDTGELNAVGGGTIRRAFGLDRNFKLQTGVRDLTATVTPGQIGYVYGASGSGKTTLLSLVADRRAYVGAAHVSGSVSLPGDASIGTLEGEFPDGALIDSIGAHSLEESVFALNSAGLAEPRLYLSRFGDLSAGQRYRARLARLICSGSNVWLLDEFASGLDDATALAVGRTFARAARSKSAICVLAAVRRYPLANAIEPDIVVHLSQIGKSSVFTDWRVWAGLR